MKGEIYEDYRGMKIKCSYSHTDINKDTNKIESFWNIEAFKNGELKGSWEYSTFRVEPNNPNPFNTYFSALPEDIRQSGRELVDRIIEKRE
jgi:Icc-related predicted phosphoesterase